MGFKLWEDHFIVLNFPPFFHFFNDFLSVFYVIIFLAL